MAVNAYNGNITMDALDEEERGRQTVKQEKKSNGFDEKNYLDVRLNGKEKTKQKRIRILPLSSTNPNPFMHVHVHNVEVPKDMVPQGSKPFKTYICLSDYWNPDIDHETYGNKCPFCEENNRAYKWSQEEGISEEVRKERAKYSCSFKPFEAIILRCIDRDHEDEGVKFWKFNIRKDKTDPYNQILSLVKQRKEESLEATGEEVNILDLTNGKDLILTITQGNTDNQSTVTVMDAGFSTPLSKDVTLAQSWIDDSKTATDVFTIKPYEYLKLILEKKIPWHDKMSGKWIDKAEVDAKYKKDASDADNAVKDAEDKYINMASQNAPKYVAPPTTTNYSTQPSNGTVIGDSTPSFDEDLPF